MIVSMLAIMVIDRLGKFRDRSAVGAYMSRKDNFYFLLVE
jgi:hypothetical protein